jgi:aryl-alcohol dehydrogenase-like predicted oxidoreductase
MKFKYFSNSKKKISQLGFGCWAIGSDKGTGYGKIDIKEAKKSLNYAFDNGINFFDTANLYGNGFSEKILGEVFKNRSHEIFIASKGGTVPHDTLYMPQNFSEKFLEDSLDKSLKRLQVECIDLYQLHSPAIKDVKLRTINALKKFKKKGKINFFGISSRSPSDALFFSKFKSLHSLQVNMNLIDQRVVDVDLFSNSIKNKQSIIVRSPLVFGFLTGKIDKSMNFKKKDHRKLFPKEQLQIWHSSIKLFKEIYQRNNISPSVFAIRYCLDFKGVTSVIPGMNTRKQVKENLKSIDTKNLSAADHNLIRNIYLKNNFYLKSLKGTKDKI